MPFLLFLAPFLTSAFNGFMSVSKALLSLVPVAVEWAVKIAKHLIFVGFWLFVAFVAGVPLTFAIYHLNMLFVFGLSWFLCWQTIVMLKGMVAAVLALWVRNVLRS